MSVQNPALLPVVAKTVISRSKSHSNPLSVVSLLGVCVDVQLHLKLVTEEKTSCFAAEVKVWTVFW